MLLGQTHVLCLARRLFVVDLAFTECLLDAFEPNVARALLAHLDVIILHSFVHALQSGLSLPMRRLS